MSRCRTWGLVQESGLCVEFVADKKSYFMTWAFVYHLVREPCRSQREDVGEITTKLNLLGWITCGGRCGEDGQGRASSQWWKDDSGGNSIFGRMYPCLLVDPYMVKVTWSGVVRIYCVFFHPEPKHKNYDLHCSPEKDAIEWSDNCGVKCWGGTSEMEDSQCMWYPPFGAMQTQWRAWWNREDNVCSAEFCMQSSPDKFKLGCVSYPVRAFVPNPLQCFRCLGYGQVAAVCRKKKFCVLTVGVPMVLEIRSVRLEKDRLRLQGSE